ncbi:uncharacterized protein [Linepithema humile]|uniref:uncharacterized protein isoform X2 n=1 Tax=Linepithema humile TaxID=83485 RepID=UPI00351F64B6
MVRCIVPGCSMTNEKNERKSELQKTLEQNLKISLHRLPKDIKKRNLWLKNIGLDENINLKKSASVCSLHFKAEDINRTLDKIFLRENAVPYSDAFVDSTLQYKNIENEENYLNSSFSFDNQPLYLEASFSSNNTHCTKKLNTENQEYNEDKNMSMQADEQMLLDEFTGEFVRRKEHLSAGKLQEHYTVLDEKLFDNCTTSPKNLPGYSNISRSTSVSPQHLQDDRDDTIKYLKASLEEHKRKSQQTIRNLKRKLKQKKSEPDFDIVISFLKSKLNKNYLDILEQMDLLLTSCRGKERKGGVYHGNRLKCSD